LEYNKKGEIVMGNCLSSKSNRFEHRGSTSSSTFDDKNRKSSIGDGTSKRRMSLAPIPSSDPSSHRPVFQQPQLSRHRNQMS